MGRAETETEKVQITMYNKEDGQDLAFVCCECKVGTTSLNMSFDVAKISINPVQDKVEENVKAHCNDGVKSSLPSDDEHDSDTEVTYTLVNAGSSRG